MLHYKALKTYPEKKSEESDEQIEVEEGEKM
jgi:hypothetical protein